MPADLDIPSPPPVRAIAPGALDRLATPDRSLFQRYRGWIIGPALVVMTLVGLYAAMLRPFYRAEAVLLNTMPAPEQPAASAFAPEADSGRHDIEALALAPAVLQAVVQQSGLAARLAEDDRAIDALWLRQEGAPLYIRHVGAFVDWLFVTLGRVQEQVQQIFGAEDDTAASMQAEDPAARAEAYLRSAVSVAEKGNAVAIRVDDFNARWARDLAGMLADTVIQAQVQLQFEALESGRDWLESQRTGLLQIVLTAERQLQLLKADLERSEAAAKAPAAAESEPDLANALQQAEETQSRLQIVIDRITAVLAAPDLIGVDALVQELARADLSRMLSEDAALRRRETELLTETGENDPELQALRSRREATTATLRGALEKLENERQQELAILQVEIGQMQRRLQRRQAASPDSANLDSGSDVQKLYLLVTGQRQRLEQAQKNLQEFETRYAPVLARLDPSQLAPSLALLHPATLPEEAHRTHPLIWMGIAFLITAWAMYLYIAARHRLHRGIESGRQLQALAGIEVIGITPIVRGAGRADRQPHRLTQQRPNSAYAESIHCLIASLAMRPLPSDLESRSSGMISVLITSAEAGEGKTTLALSLATAYAAGRRRVLLIDGDVRMPSVHDQLGIPMAPGLLDILRGDSRFRDCVRRDRNSGIEVVTAGVYRPDSGQAFFNERFRLLIARLERDYDVIVVDGPPIGGIADTALLAGFTDRVVMAVRWRHTPRAAAAAAAQQLTAIAHDAVAVMTMVDTEAYAKSGFGEAELFLSARKNYYVS